MSTTAKMATAAKVTFPKPGAALTPNFFPACGFATIGLKLRGVLIGDQGTQALGKTVRQPVEQAKWMIVFTDIAPKDRECFRLEIWEDRPGGKLLAQVEDISVKVLLRSVGIDYPAANSNQCKDNVMAFGTLTPPDTAIASLTLGTDDADFVHFDPETGTWAAQFGVAAGTYTLSIEGNGGGSDSRSGINCQDQYC
jgi:hypothetical protein